MKERKKKKPKKGLVLSRSHIMLLLTLIFAVIILSGTTGYLYGYGKSQEVQKREKAAEPTPTQQPTLTPTSTPMPTPTPKVVYIEKKTDNSEIIKSIDAQITKANAEIEDINRFLKDNQTNQDAQARRRDLMYQVGQLELEKIKYQ